MTPSCLVSRQFNTSAQLDRSDNSFPSQYVAAISSRTAPACRGIGAKEAIAEAKESGSSHKFLGIRRPSSLDARCLS